MKIICHFGPPPPFSAGRPLRFSGRRDPALSGLARPDPVWCAEPSPKRNCRRPPPVVGPPHLYNYRVRRSTTTAPSSLRNTAPLPLFFRPHAAVKRQSPTVRRIAPSPSARPEISDRHTTRRVHSSA
ncbi:hypothetical protein ASPZODRAFT_20819 [Penicilliopsis zonata CBS 506.65]|uniref:Uncharacterized protein n=1 Tax=Penicilliopsis zonata CBS 506.65 TaxID=1073090 RepID=A0A1L9S4F7_9EURO|nr:hypothetical protein ASPZODRAFT_20819 [Penicilliopsis zonata CBS 506.65]OJJ42052.1 hypothetical protein ASPZODRAFT_20819 [Penicilliopsis zonata CBS 506.65]